MEIDVAKILNAVDEINRIPTSRPLQSTDGLCYYGIQSRSVESYKEDVIKRLNKLVKEIYEDHDKNLKFITFDDETIEKLRKQINDESKKYTFTPSDISMIGAIEQVVDSIKNINVIAEDENGNRYKVESFTSEIGEIKDGKLECKVIAHTAGKKVVEISLNESETK